MIKRLRFFHESDCFFHAVQHPHDSISTDQHIVDCASHMDSFVTAAFQHYNETGDVKAMLRAINRIEHEYRHSVYPVTIECMNIAIQVLRDAIEQHEKTYK